MSSDKIEAERRQIVSVVLALYNTGRPAHGDAVDHIMASPVMRHHFDGLQAAITKANEELREEVELAKQEGVAETLQQIDCLTGGDGEYRLSTCPDRNCPDEDAMRKKIVARFDDLRATIDRLTHDLTVTGERYHAMVKERDELEAENATLAAGACNEPNGLIGDEHGHFYCTRQKRLSAMQEAIDEAVRRAHGDGMEERPWGCLPGMWVAEPLRPFATKPNTPSARIMSDKDRENPVEGAHPATKPEPEVDPLVALCTELFAALRRYEADADPEFPSPPEHREMMHRAEVALAARGGRVVFDGREG